MIAPPISINLGGPLSATPYPLVWGNLARHRFMSIPREHRSLVGPAQLAQLTWAAYAGGIEHPCPNWEHVLALIADLPPERYDAVDKAVASVLPPPPEKKAGADTPAPEPSDAEKKSASAETGPSPADASA